MNPNAMADVLNKLANLATPAILVTVAGVKGSAPREVGARMAVLGEIDSSGANKFVGTIGGGHLEYEALTLARELLQQSQQAPILKRYPLGATLGQCCGGSVELLFESVLPNNSWAPALSRLLHTEYQANKVVRAVSMTGEVKLNPAHIQPSDITGSGLEKNAHGWQFIDVIRPPSLHLVLFGAGHVGQALVKVLGELPCQITWVDERESMFPSERNPGLTAAENGLPNNVRIVVSDDPIAEVAAAPAGSCYLVMTHNHALDQNLAEAILTRDAREHDVVWFGLIGSQTKRRLFEQRMAARGISHASLARMICPIGLPSIAGKQPAVIAVSVAAQLLSLGAQN